MDTPLVLAAAVIVLALVQWHAARSRPKYLVTLQKRTSDATQEVVTIQGNYPAGVAPSDIWLETEKMGVVAANRMQTVNEEIIETNKAIEEEILRRRVDALPHVRGEIADKRRRRMAKALHVKPEEVDALLQQHRWHGLQKDADAREAEEAVV